MNVTKQEFGYTILQNLFGLLQTFKNCWTVFNFWITHRIVIAVASFTIFMNVVILMLVKKFFTVSFSRKWSEERIERNVHFRKTATIEHSF